jgi:hypothetical protein
MRGQKISLIFDSSLRALKGNEPDVLKNRARSGGKPSIQASTHLAATKVTALKTTY